MIDINNNIEDDEDYLDDIEFKDDNILDIELYPIAKEFIFNHHLTSSIIGPVGSGKSTACLLKLMVYSMCIMPCSDGIRRSRWLIVRNTKKELKDTTVRTFMQWLGRFGVYKETDMNFYMRINDTEAEFQFLALDDEKDTKKLLSLECTGIYYNECREINEKVYQTSLQRIGRFPSLKANGTKAWFDLKMVQMFGLKLKPSNKKRIMMHCIFSDTNPPKVGSYWHKLFECLLFDEETGADNNPPDFKLYRQPSGMSPDAENRKYLPEGYYESILINTPEQADVMVHVKYGTGESGLGVYRSYYKYDDHVKKGLYESFYTRDKKLAIGMDFGLNPACVIGQYLDGKLYCYEEVITKNNNKRGLEQFLDEELIPLLKKKYQHHKLNREDIVIIGDPAGAQRNQDSGRSNFELLKSRGFKVRNDTMDNKISPRVEAVKNLMKPHMNMRLEIMRQKISGQPLDIKSAMIPKPILQVDVKCSFLIEGFGGNYFYEADKKTGFKDVPVKNEWSHIQDAMQYLAKHIFEYKGRYLDRYYTSINNDSYSPADDYTGY